MPDREKVMLGLELCSRPEGWTVGCLLDCPYDHEEGCRRNLMMDAIALLKAQEPKPPIIKENSYGWKFYYCPSCGKEFYQNNKFSFCEKCGQEVKWE